MTEGYDPIYRDGRTYDAMFGGNHGDLPFYLDKINEFGQPALELACGTGRLTIPLAERGIDIVGLDIAEPMLAEARRKAAAKGVQVEWVHADCRDFDLRRKFSFIMFPANAIAHLHEIADVRACFARVREHLARSGRFVLQMFNPRLDILMRDASQRYPAMEYDDPDGRGKVVVTESKVYDRASQVSHVKWYFKFEDSEQETVQELNLRMFFPQELDALLQCSGFEIEAKFGGLDGSPFTSDSPLQLPLCAVSKG